MEQENVGAETQADDLATALGEAFDAAEAESTEAEPAPEPEAAPEAEPEGEPDPEPEGEGEAGDEIPDAPEHWSQADKDAFNALPDEAKPLFLNTRKSLESGYDKKFQELADQRKSLERWNELDQMIEPYRQQLQLAGINEVGYFKQLMAADRYLREKPQEAIRWLAQQYQIDIPSGQEEPEGDQVLDPAAQKYIKSLESKLSTLESKLNQREQSEKTASQAEAQARVQAFQDAKDDQGNLQHPHFDRVKGQMSALIRSGAAKDMDSAYSQAVWADPELRADLIAGETAKAKAEAQRKAEVAKTKKASSKNIRSTPGKETPKAAGSWKEELERQFDAATS